MILQGPLEGDHMANGRVRSSARDGITPDTTCWTHLVQLAIQRRQLRKLFRASASTGAPTRMQQSEPTEQVPHVPWPVQVTKEVLPPRRSITRLLLSTSLDKHCPVLLRGSTLWLPGSAESTPQSNVDCQLGPVEARQIPSTSMRLCCPASRHRSVGDALLHVPSTCMHPCVCPMDPTACDTHCT